MTPRQINEHIAENDPEMFLTHFAIKFVAGLAIGIIFNKMYDKTITIPRFNEKHPGMPIL